MKRLVLLTALMAWLHLPVQAQSAPTRCDPQTQCCREATLPGDPGCAGAGNPINILTGNKYQREDDLPALPGVLGVELVRHYNSAQALQGDNQANGLLGRGWRLSYEIALQADGEHRRVLTLADGSAIAFTRGVLRADRFLPADAGQGRIVQAGSAYEWQALDGQRLRFDRQGRLEQITVPSGEFTTLGHDPQGRLIRVTDPQGRSLQLHYADAKSTHRFRGVTAIDTPLGRFEYVYGANEHAANLVSVSRPGGVQRLYHHEDARHPGALTGISVKDHQAPQRISTYLYDAQGLAVLSVKGRPAALALDAAGQPVWPYRLQDGTGLAQVIVERGKDTVTVFNALGQKSQARWVEIDGQRLMADFTGAGCATCPPADTRWAYDKQARVVRTTQLDANGQPLHAEQAVLDAWGRITSVERIAWQGGKEHAVRLARLEYPLPFDEREGAPADATQPALIARPSVVAGREHTTRIARNAHGQPTAITEEGLSPVDAQGQGNATPITRTTTYTYTRVNGRSVLSTIDGPLANGPKNTPEDSDITTLQWDERGSVVKSLTEPGGFDNQTLYDDAGRIAQVRNDEGRLSRFVHGPAGLLARIERVAPGGFTQIQSNVYDAQGRIVETGSGADGSYRPAMRQAFDAADRVLWQAHAIGSARHWRYDAEGRVLQEDLVSPAITNQTHYEWGQRGLHAVSDSAGRRLDAAALRSLPVRPEPVEGPVRTRHLRDDFGRTVLTVSPDSGVTLRTFDAADRLIAMRDALGNEARYEHDAAGRVVRQMVQAKNDGPVLTQWRYQGRHLVELIHPTQSERYTYDANGWRTRRTVLQGNLEATARYTFDAQGQLAATTLPDGSRIGYERNGQAQVTTITRSRVHTEWLRRFEQPQVLAQDFERDIVGLKAYTAGNGIQARFIRSREGTLARVLYRQPQRKVMTAQGRVPQFIGRNTQDFFERFMGIVPAHAAEPVEALGAVREPFDEQALIDHRYLWDVRGNLLLDAQRAGVQPTDSGYAYDGANRLIVAQTRAASDAVIKPVADKPAPAEHRYYLHDAAGRRVLARQDGATRRIAYEDSTHRWTSDAQTQAEYDAVGQPIAIGTRRFDWDAHGRLLQVREGEQAVARYTYSHRGERIAKAAGAQTHYLYDDASQLLAELDASGAITRQYVYAADLPIAVIDGPTPLHQDANAWLQAWRDVQHLLRSWIGKEDTITWLHTNHLGAPEAATDAQGQLLWQASYAPSGRAKTTGSFTLNLRLPGQYADTETGLHYNLNRYYDPERGQYLSPDPLANAPGYPDGPNPYAYVRFNPLRYVDPLGLILFAFDGTGNTNDAGDLAELGNGLSNVWQFRQLYNDGNARYVTGVGTRHRETDPQFGGDIFLNWGNTSTVDLGGNFTGPARIDRMIAYFNAEAELFTENSRLMDIDIIGFSRGAAQARDFANRINANTRNGQYRYTITVDGQTVQRCQMINFRFMGLWDTVLSTNLSGRGYNMNIVPGFQYVAQAVALNEYRGNNFRRLPNSTGAFPLQSIVGGAVPVGQERIERGFIGAHADIGGGFPGQENALPLVALSWMVEQARNAGVRMFNPVSSIPASPVIHDKSDNQYCTGGPGCSEDRQVLGGSGGTQRRMTGTGMIHADTAQFIRYYPADINADGTQTRTPRADQSTGTVDMARYLQWLRDNGYELGNLQVQ